MAHGVNPRSRLIRFSKNSSFHYFTVDEMGLRLMKLALDEMALYRFQRYLQQNGICKASIDVEIELDMEKKQFASFKNTALETKRIAESEIMGFEDFESILVHCQERIRVMVEANQNGEPLTPDEVSFLNTLNDSVCALVDALKNDNGILRVTSARQYSNVITAFVDAIRESEN